jgi:uncharacterized protein YndB with AHSA1/START domain
MQDAGVPSIERELSGAPAEVWELWTTKEGIEGWWGPEGFAVAVRGIDLRQGGRLEYAMTATGELEREFVERAGLPATTELRLTYSEVEPLRRLGWEQLVDFVPNHEPYPVATLVRLEPVAGGTRVAIDFDPMHDERWTELSVRGRESELDKLAALLVARP